MNRADSGAAAGAGIGTVLLALAQQWPKSPAWRSVFIYLVPAISFGIGALVTWVLVEFQTSINIWTIQRTVKKLKKKKTERKRKKKKKKKKKEKRKKKKRKGGGAGPKFFARCSKPAGTMN